MMLHTEQSASVIYGIVGKCCLWNSKKAVVYMEQWESVIYGAEGKCYLWNSGKSVIYGKVGKCYLWNSANCCCPQQCISGRQQNVAHGNVIHGRKQSNVAHGILLKSFLYGRYQTDVPHRIVIMISTGDREKMMQLVKWLKCYLQQLAKWCYPWNQIL